MPVQVPQIQPSPEGGGLPGAPTLDPGGFAQLSTSGISAVGKAFTTLGTEAEKTATTLLKIRKEEERIKKTLDEETDRLAVTGKITEYKMAIADQAFTVSNDADILPGDKAAKVEALARKAQEKASKELANPRQQRLFQLKSEEVLGTTIINARAEGLKLQLADVKAKTEVEIRALEQEAVFAVDPTRREAAITDINGRVDRLLARGIYSGDEASAAKIQSLARIEEGRIRRDWRDATKRPEILRQLASGERVGLAPDTQLTLRETLQSGQRAEDTRLREEDERAQKAQADAFDKELTDLHRAGDLPGMQRVLGEARRVMSAEQYHKWDERANTPKKPPEIVDDPATRRRLQGLVYDMRLNPKATYDAVLDAVDKGLISSPTGDKYLNELQGRIYADQRHAEAVANRRVSERDVGLQERKFKYTQGKDLVDEAFRTTGAFDFDGTAQGVKEEALLDYYNSTNPYKAGGMSTEQWVSQRLPLFRAKVADKADQRFDSIKTQLTNAGVPVQGNLSDPNVVRATQTYLVQNRDALTRRYGAQGFNQMAAAAHEAHLMVNSPLISRRPSAPSGGGAAKPAGTSPTEPAGKKLGR